jgi:RNA polymerase sigma-54 factor
MKQSLQLRLGQQLTMTPQLQQAIRLLQLSTVDLQAEVQELLDNNPLLEMAEGDEAATPEGELAGATVAEQAVAETRNGETAMGEESPAAREENGDADTRPTDSQLSEIPEDLPVDSDWDEIYDAPLTTGTGSDSDGSFLENQASTAGDSLRDHLVWQMRLSTFSPQDQIIAEAIIDAISEDGYLSVPIESIWEGVKADFDVDLDEVVVVLRRVQSFDPPGVGARDLRECLLLQLNAISSGEASPALERARVLVGDNLDLLANRDYAQLMRKMRLEKEELQEVVALIQSLNPRPGGAVAVTRTEYVVPDVIVRKFRGQWRVELNSDAVPRLRINALYANLIKRADSSAENTFLKNNLQEARWFIKSLQSRNETLLKVAQCIVDHQQEFFELGDEAMKPLVLHDVAEAVGMHESTISRVTSQKYMHTPRGIFELKYFFSSHVSTASGEQCSATAIRALIKKMIADEHPEKPFSDSKIAEVLGKQGINVARRTVAKYRESMSIPPSNERKRLA